MKKHCNNVETIEDLVLYKCSPDHASPPENATHQKNAISLLYSSICVDKYFGASPTCKLEKSMSYFL